MGVAKKGSALAIASLVVAIIALIFSVTFTALLLAGPSTDNTAASDSSTSSALSASSNANGQGQDSNEDGDTIVNSTTNVTVVDEDSDEDEPIVQEIWLYNETTEYYDVDCQCNTSVYGVLNAGITYKVGGYDGWEYASAYPDLYPFPDIHLSIGDKLLFKTRSSTGNDLWLVTEEVFASCDFSDTSNLRQLAMKNDLRGDKEDDPRYPGGHELLIQPHLVEEFGNPLLFTSAEYWADFEAGGRSSCLSGIKVKVYVEDRTAVRVLTEGYDISTSDTVKDLEASIGHLSRMLILQQFATEQRVRSEGNSGLTNVRGKYDGDAAYDDGTFSSGQVAAIHDHSDHIRVVGIGEIQAVLNGVEFRTRHNDYNLKMPSTTSGEYNEAEEIVGPDVPPEVLSAGDASAQIDEMIEWFRAFKTQNVSHRNYPLYFKPILCYLEGTWILDDDILEEPFDSDRHQIDAKSWQQLHDKIRWMANSGRKSTLENFSHLPSSIRNLLNDTYPIVSNWEYRILCAPLKNDIPTSRFRIEDDLSVQLMGGPETREELYYSRRARFKLNTNVDKDDPDSDHDWDSGRTSWNYLDYLMEQIPGKDNYMANLTDVFPDGSSMASHHVTDETLNSGFYSRFYGLSEGDAMGSSKHRRGFSDRYLFAAQTTQEKVSPIQFQFEMTDADGNDIYVPTTSRWSYAIPLEIIYQTPLSTWNPYEIEEVEDGDFDYSRSGACTSTDAFVAWTTKEAYFTPDAMFEGAADSSTADTASSNVCSLLADGSLVGVGASGHWITFPDIAGGVGPVRQRYPIFPIHESGSAAFKEVKALEAVSLPSDYDDPVANPDGFFGDSRDLEYGFELNLEGGGHSHVCYLKGSRVSKTWLLDAENDSWCTTPDCYIEAECDTRNGHQHLVRIWRSYAADGETWVYHLRDCRFGTESDEDMYPYPTGWTTFDVNNVAICSDLHNTLDR